MKGERTPDGSEAAHPKALVGCSCSGDFAIFFSFLGEKFCVKLVEAAGEKKLEYSERRR